MEQPGIASMQKQQDLSELGVCSAVRTTPSMIRVLSHVYQLSLSSLERLVSQACFYQVGRLVSEAVF